MKLIAKLIILNSPNSYFWHCCYCYSVPCWRVLPSLRSFWRISKTFKLFYNLYVVVSPRSRTARKWILPFSSSTSRETEKSPPLYNWQNTFIFVKFTLHGMRLLVLLLLWFVVLLRGKNRLETAPQSLIDFILVTMPVSYHHRWMPFQIGYLSQFIVSRNSFPLGIAVCVVWVIRTLFSLYIFLSHSRTRALSYSLTFGALVVCLFNDRT